MPQIHLVDDHHRVQRLERGDLVGVVHVVADDHQAPGLLDLAARALDLVEQLLHQLVEPLARQARGRLAHFQGLGPGHRRAIALAQLVELLHQLASPVVDPDRVRDVLVGNPAQPVLGEPVPEVLEIGQVQLDRLLVALARRVEDVHVGQLLVVLPHAGQPLVLVAQAGGDQAVQEAVLAVELQLPAGADLGAGVGVDVGLGPLHLDRLVVAGHLEGQHPGRMDDLLRHVGVEPADHFPARSLPVLDGDALRERRGQPLHFVQSLQRRVHAVALLSL